LEESLPPIQTTPVIVESPEMGNNITQSSVWWVNLDNETVGHEQNGRRPFFVISSNKYNKNSKTSMGFCMSQSLNKSQNRFSIKVNYKNSQGEYQQGWVNVSQMQTLSSERFDKILGQSTKGFVYKIMENFNKRILDSHNNHREFSRYHRDHQDHRDHQEHRGRGRGQRGRGQSHRDHQEHRGRGRGQRGRGQSHRDHQEHRGRGRGQRGRGQSHREHQEHRGRGRGQNHHSVQENNSNSSPQENN
jgi:mRNA-degrading endonuclease toxin of MazEF toxin-antitoxin module